LGEKAGEGGDYDYEKEKQGEAECLVRGIEGMNRLPAVMDGPTELGGRSGSRWNPWSDRCR